MASTPASTRLTEQARQEQVAIRNGFLAEFLALWSLLDIFDLDRTTPGWVRAVIALVELWRQISANAALDYYRDFRRLEVPGVDPLPEITFIDTRSAERAARRAAREAAPSVKRNPAVPRSRIVDLSGADRRDGLVIDWGARRGAVRASLEVLGPINIKSKIARGQTPEAAARKALVEVSGAAGRHVLDGGRQANITAMRNDGRLLGWVRVTDGNPCSFCAMLASRGVSWGPYGKTSFAKSDARFVGGGEFKVHDHCVTPETLVTGPSVEVAYRRPYEGELLIIRLASGDELSITPNHPVLTNRGWVEAGLLREGDDVFRRSGSDLETLAVPHEDDVPTPIQDVWGSRRMDSLGAMPVAAEDFHGDGRGTQGYVDVVTPHREFTVEGFFKAIEHRAHHLVTCSDVASVASALTTLSDPLAGLLALGGPAERGVGSFGLRQALFRGSEGVADLHGLGHGASWNPSLFQPTFHGGALDTVVLAERLLSSAADVLADEVPVRRFDPASAALWWPDLDAHALEVPTQRVRVNARLGGALAERLASGVQLSRVRELRRVHYSGHVLNLQTAEGWYSANGVIVSNCACSLEPVYSRDTALPGNSKEMRDLWNAHIHGKYSGKEALKAWRRFYEKRQREQGRPTVGFPEAA